MFPVNLHIFVKLIPPQFAPIVRFLSHRSKILRLNGSTIDHYSRLYYCSDRNRCTEIVTKSSGAKCRLLIHYDCLVKLFHARAER